MNQDWQNYLTQQGAQLHEGEVRDFGNLQAELLAARDSTIVCDLSQLGTIKVAGEARITPTRVPRSKRSGS